MNKEEILIGITEVLYDVFGRSDFAVTRETKASDVAEWDSMNHINIIVASEIRYGIKFRTFHRQHGDSVLLKGINGSHSTGGKGHFALDGAARNHGD